MIKLFAMTLGLGFASAALAQTTPAPDATAPVVDSTPPAAPAGEATPPADLSMGQEAAAADGPGSIYVAAKFDAWEQRCVKTADGSDPCQLYQLLKDKDANPVAEISLFAMPAGGQAAAGATILVPLETLLVDQLTIQIDASPAKHYPYTWCSTAGCVARVGFTKAEVDSFKKGAKATITIVPVVAPDQKVALDVSLKGFTAGFTAVAATPAQ